MRRTLKIQSGAVSAFNSSTQRWPQLCALTGRSLPACEDAAPCPPPARACSSNVGPGKDHHAPADQPPDSARADQGSLLQQRVASWQQRVAAAAASLHAAAARASPAPAPAHHLPAAAAAAADADASPPRDGGGASTSVVAVPVSGPTGLKGGSQPPPHLLLPPPTAAQRRDLKARAAEGILHAGAALNRLTGYDAISAVKVAVETLDAELRQLKQQLQAAKSEYERQVGRQAALQKEMNALLQRKSGWVPADVERFTALYANEHATEADVATAQERYNLLGEAVEDVQLRLMTAIRERYTQEQLWSDKIRQASTWWTWGLMGLHFGSFMAVYLVLEPRRRAALRDALTEAYEAHSVELQRLLESRLSPRVAAADAAVAAMAPAAASSSPGAAWEEEAQRRLAEQMAAVVSELQAVRQQVQQLTGSHALGTASSAPAAQQPAPMAAAARAEAEPEGLQQRDDEGQREAPWRRLPQWLSAHVRGDGSVLLSRGEAVGLAVAGAVVGAGITVAAALLSRK